MSVARAVVKSGGMLGAFRGTHTLRHQDIKVRRDVHDMSFLYGAIIISFIIVLVAFVYLWSRVTVVNLGYEISAANSARSELTEINKRLRIELVKLKSPERIERMATAELGLNYPVAEQVISIK